jgi:hypothetical protein
MSSGSEYFYSSFKWQATSGSGLTDRSTWQSWSKNGKSKPDWRKRIARGYDASTDFSGTKVTDTVTMGSTEFTAEFNSGGGVWVPRYSYSWGQPLTVDTTLLSLPSASTTVLNKAKARFAQDLRNASSSIQGGVVLGELGETLRMIKRPFKTMYDDVPKYLADLNRRTRRTSNRKQLRKIVADTWLERAFGWLPLMSDIRGGIDALDRLEHDKLDVRQRIRGQDMLIVPISNSQIVSDGRPYSLHPYTDVFRQQDTLVQYILVGGVKLKYQNKAAFARHLLGFTLTDFVPTLYELMPWSFLIDYFSNLGDVISSRSVNWTTVYYATQTRRLLSTTRWQFVTDVGRTLQAYPTGSVWRNAQVSGSPSTRVIENKSVLREARVPGDPYPDFQFELPGLSLKWLNIAALAATRDRSRHTFSRLG